jgi:protocatechuate 3,4-dioxygenase beta subunit
MRGIVLLGLLSWCCLSVGQQPIPKNASGHALCASCITPETLEWKVSLVQAGEPGEPLVMRGSVYKSDGRTPAPNIVVFVYQTDATGHYNHPDSVWNPRLRGWMRTGSDGRYEFRSIKPAAYPNHSEPAHIHVHVYGEGVPEYFLDDYWFEGDTLLSSEQITRAQLQGRFSNIVKLTWDGKTWQGVRDLRLH